MDSGRGDGPGCAAMKQPVLALLLLMASLAPLPREAAADPVQRMLVDPGCYVLPPGQSADVSAYCLDQTRRAPAEGVTLGKTAPSLGDAVVHIGAETVPLAAMIAGGALQIEGLGGFSQVRLRNTTGATITICFN